MFPVGFAPGTDLAGKLNLRSLGVTPGRPVGSNSTGELPPVSVALPSGAKGVDSHFFIRE